MPDTAPSRFPEIVPLGLDGLLVRFADRFAEDGNRAALAFRAAVEAAGLDGLRETSCSLGATYLRFDPRQVPVERLEEQVTGLLEGRDWYHAPLPAGRRLWSIPTVWGGADGPQLDTVAALAGVSAQEAVAMLSVARLRVMTIGFAPGLPYLGQLPEIWNLPRQTDLQTRVPPGALGLAVRQCVLFPAQTPTGWYHVARTAFRCFRPESGTPFPLRPGDELTFPAVSAREIAALEGDPDGGARCEVTG
ncbi:MAG: 5-oxoprolinase subunit B family protein [Tropicimonas sp.]|uniref:5-oxoprolinase subunit B family protein n=1 Tax=Tropicimonas sp. TaxID=2067044 RepID=UPI003A8A8178